MTSTGTDLETFWAGLLARRDGTSAIERFRVDDLRVGRGGEIKDVPRADGGPAVECRASQLLLAAANNLLRGRQISFLRTQKKRAR